MDIESSTKDKNHFSNYKLDNREIRKYPPIHFIDGMRGWPRISEGDKAITFSSNLTVIDYLKVKRPTSENKNKCRKRKSYCSRLTILPTGHDSKILFSTKAQADVATYHNEPI